MCVRLEWRKRPLKYTVSSTLHFFFFLILLNTHRSQRSCYSCYDAVISRVAFLLHIASSGMIKMETDGGKVGNIWARNHEKLAFMSCLFLWKGGIRDILPNELRIPATIVAKVTRNLKSPSLYQLFNTKMSQKFCKSFQRADVAVVAYQLPALSISMFFTFNDHSMKKPYRSSRFTSPSKPMWYDSLPLTPAEHWFRILPPPPPPPPPQWIYLVEI